MKIAVELDRLVVSGGGTVRFADIVDVAAEKVGKITYDEVFLIVRDRSGEAITCGELDEGFAEAEHALETHLSGFPSDWRAAAEEAPVGLRAQVWPTSS
ncbi:MAG TPA: hypothetical protein VEW04_04640 [Allosphingosinicella sp.]|nr:hypothetical protein [Allosphingosinicella sp.]